MAAGRAPPRRVGIGLVERMRDEPAAAFLGIAIALWTVVFSMLVVLRQDRFRTIDFDLGIHDQAIWLLAHGQTFDTVRGLPVFGHHATFAYYLLVPLQWLGAGPNVWNVLQVIAIVVIGDPDLPPGPAPPGEHVVGARPLGSCGCCSRRCSSSRGRRSIPR